MTYNRIILRMHAKAALLSGKPNLKVSGYLIINMFTAYRLLSSTYSQTFSSMYMYLLFLSYYSAFTDSKLKICCNAAMPSKFQ